MEKRIGWCCIVAAAVLAWTVSSQDVLAAETVGICVNNVKGSDAHFTVDYKDGATAMAEDSEEYSQGNEKCIDVPAAATDVKLTVFKTRLILWSEACSKSWSTAPEQPVHVKVSGSTFGSAECEGL
jgi:hypothetical protein